MSSESGELALVLGGGGARAAYQAGALRAVARRHPDLDVPILTGVSAGAINSTAFANRTGTFAESAESLADTWLTLADSDVFEIDAPSLLEDALRLTLSFALGAPKNRIFGLLDSSPLRRTLTRILGAEGGRLAQIDRNLAAGRLKAVAITATCYTTGQTITFLRGRDFEAWERPQRKSVETEIAVDHVMASSALPLFFPSVPIDGQWYGDGGVRLVAPFAPALHLGAGRILTISTRYAPSRTEADRHLFEGPPGPAQILGSLYNAIFFDMLDHDALRIDRMNQLIRRMSGNGNGSPRTVELLVLRPSRDLATLANEFEARLPRGFRFLSRRLGTRRARSQDLLSMLMFQPDYLRALYDLGVADAEARAAEIDAFVDGSG